MINALFVSKEEIWGDFLSFHLSEQSRDGRIAVAKPVEMVEVDRNDLHTVTEPAFRISLKSPEGASAAQRLMDQLWSLGLRPSDIGTPGHLAATTKHLEDMRAIAFAKLDTPKP